MRILLTGASSFTGYWFAKALAQAGHTIIAPLPRSPASYEGIRAKRVANLAPYAEIIWSCKFGDSTFMQLAASGPWDRLCHHAAQVGDYRSPDFDIAGAVQANTFNLQTILQIMRPKGLSAVVLTGSVFEANEGTGSTQLDAFSPYGVSKGQTADIVRTCCEQMGLPFAKFVIPNPFGPFEEPRFCNYLMQCWREGKSASVKTPAYIRDNIHASLLALCYAQTVIKATDARFSKYNPSGYAESQGAFTQRFSREIGRRLNIKCAVDLVDQKDFSEPLTRVNTDIPDHAALGWNEMSAWDELAEYYRTQL